MESQKFTLNKNDLISIGKGALIALAGSLLTYFTGIVANIDVGVYTPLLVAGFSVVANVVRKWLAGQNPKS